MGETEYKLTYFKFSGRGEQVRLLFALCGVDFDDERLDFPTFVCRQAQGDFHFGSVPMLTHGDFTLVQGPVIIQYLGRKFGIWPKGPKEDALAASWASAAEDLRGKVAAALFAKGDAFTALKKQSIETVLPTWLARYERTMGGKYCLGDTMYACDACLYDVLARACELFGDEAAKVIANYSKISAFYNMMKANPNIKKWEADHVQYAFKKQ